jgi:tetratricopeptide (TPR) repeat protein
MVNSPPTGLDAQRSRIPALAGNFRALVRKMSSILNQLMNNGSANLIEKGEPTMANRRKAFTIKMIFLLLLCGGGPLATGAQTKPQTPQDGPAKQAPGQFSRDFVAGEVPSDEQIAELEKEAAAQPGDLHIARKVAKGYFFQVFGNGQKSSIEKADRWLKRALEIKADDPETMAYLGAITAIMARSKMDLGLLNRSIELLNKAEQLAPDDLNALAVLPVTGVTFLGMPESLGLTSRALEAMGKIRRLLGPNFGRMSHHGQQRVLMTEGKAYVKLGQVEKARECFEQALKVNRDSVEAVMLKAELEKLPPRP